MLMAKTYTIISNYLCEYTLKQTLKNDAKKKYVIKIL